MASILAKNNAKVLKSQIAPAPDNSKCNCRKKNECPLPGKCLTPAVIYQAQVDTHQSKETYIGLTANSFKQRYSGHKSSFKVKKRSKETTLSKHVWDLKDAKIPYNISWKILAHAQPFSQVTGLCQLCTREKYLIIFKPNLGTLNSRNELLGSCRHKRTSLLITHTKKKKKARKKSPGN